VFLLHENQEPYLDTLKFFPHLQQYIRTDSSDTDSPSIESSFHSIDFLAAFQPGVVTITPPAKEGGPLYERKLRTYNKELQVHKLWDEGLFDGFISVSNYDPQSFLPKVLNKIELSGGIVVYSPFREPIVELQNYYLTKTPSRPILAPTVHEIRAPRWSTLKGRVRPDMTGRGGGGWIMSGVRVEEGEPELPTPKSEKKRKVKENGTKMEDVEMEEA
jgi:tRNA (adenine58-N1)-methyltransferase non-catalytic subunit